MIETEFRVYHKIDGMRYFGETPIHMLLNGDLFLDDLGNERAFKIEDVKMQYTGIKDKNGKKMFDGDILYLEPRNQWFKVFSVPGGFAVNTHQDDFYKPKVFFYIGLSDMQNCSWASNLEIKGNIYENPELLK